MQKKTSNTLGPDPEGHAIILSEYGKQTALRMASCYAQQFCTDGYWSAVLAAVERLEKHRAEGAGRVTAQRKNDSH
jgi:hypothetical protein